MKTFTNKEATEILKCSVRTFQRMKALFRLRPIAYTGHIPVFTRQQLLAVKIKHDARIERARRGNR